LALTIGVRRRFLHESNEAYCPRRLCACELAGQGLAETRNRRTVLDVPIGQGHVVLFATKPAYWWQNPGEFNMLAHSTLNFNYYPKAVAARRPTPATKGGP
jgi:hypothetical protein